MEVPRPQALESALACLLLLAAKCPDIKTHVCELIQRLLAIHGDDSLLHERCTLYLERIAFVSDRCKDVHEEEKERMKDDDNVTNHLAFPKANKKEREKKKKKQHKEGSAELLKKVKKEKKKKKKEKRKDTNSSPSSLHEDGVQENKESRSNTPRMPIAARLDDVRPYLDFTEFLYADSPALFDESSPGTFARGERKGG